VALCTTVSYASAAVAHDLAVEHVANTLDTCATHCAQRSPPARCLAACEPTQICRCGWEAPWQAAACHRAPTDAFGILCACNTGEETDVDALRTAIFGRPQDRRFSADAHAQRSLAASSDPSCRDSLLDNHATEMEHVLLVRKAVDRLKHCGFVVVRGALSQRFVSDFRTPFAHYVRGLTNGSINTDGRTSHNEPFHLHQLDRGRWEMLLPRSFAAHELLSAPTVASLVCM